MTPEQRTEAAQALLAAYRTGEPVAQLTTTHEGMTLDDAYAVQIHQIDARLADGRTIVGHKVGLTSKAMQEMLGVNEPDYGHLLDDTAYTDGDSIDAGRFLLPRAEPEVAFVLGSDLKGPGVTAEQALAAIESVLPSLEIVDSRMDWKITLLDTIADNASSGAYVLGDRAAAKTVSEVDLEGVACTLTKNGETVGEGTGAAVMGNPINALVWLANTVGERGIVLEAGHVVLPGAVCGMVPVAAGDTVTATFAGLGSVTATFVGASGTTESKE